MRDKGTYQINRIDDASRQQSALNLRSNALNLRLTDFNNLAANLHNPTSRR